MSFRIIFKKHSIMLSIRNSAADEILGNFTCKIASGEWSDFSRLVLLINQMMLWLNWQILF